MKIRPWSYLLIGLALLVLFVGGQQLLPQFKQWLPAGATAPPLRVQARAVPRAPTHASAAPPIPQVVVGTPAYYTKPTTTRYTYRNEYPADRTQWLPLYLIDTVSGQETRLGDDSNAAVFGAMNEEYLLWFFDGDLHAYRLATGQDRFIAQLGAPLSIPQMADEWVAFGEYNINGGGSATLYAANLQTQEIITLTHALGTRGDGDTNAYFGISPFLAAWFEPPKTIVVYDLQSRHEITRLVDMDAVFNEKFVSILDLSPGETVITWGRSYGYDLVTRSYFRIISVRPPGSETLQIYDVGRAGEKDRVLYWTLTPTDGTHRDVRAPLLDATPSAAPCVEGQNLVQNGDLENVATQNLWQQSGNPSDLIVNELPPNSPQAGQWAIRLGRYSNAQPTIQQTLNIPSGVKHITLAFDVRASSWDLWGGDQLQVNLIDPVTNQSILATPVQWTNRQLASGGWIPLQVDIQDWPGIDTPLQLVFRAQTDWAFPTDFTVDNIRFTTACQ